MKTMEEVNARYKEICTYLGDITVKQKGLDNQKAQLFEELSVLDDQAKKLQEPKSEA